MKVAFVIGHTSGTGKEKDQGEFSEFLKVTEWEFYNSYEFLLNDLGDVFHHDTNITSYTKRQKEMAKRTKDYDLVIELHFNSFHLSTANGCECWHNEKNETTKDLSRKFCKLMETELKLRNRGAKGMAKGERGAGFIFAQKPNSILIEPFFGSSKEDCEIISKNGAKLFCDVIPSLIQYYESKFC